MTTADTKPSAAGQHLIEQRLDALDRALLGILPRSERLALVAQVETRVRERTDSNPAAEAGSDIAMEPEIIVGAASRRAPSGTSRRRSRLALSSGILGIVALVMLFAMPITYILVSMIGEDLGEFIAISLLSIHVLVVAVGGLVAIVMGIAGLVSLSRRKGLLVGHGWAITGLCTAPLPTLVGGLLVLVTAFSLVAVQSVAVDVSSAPPPTVSSAAYLSAPPMPIPPDMRLPPKYSVPLPLSSAPTYCSPANQCPPLCLPPATKPSAAGIQPSSNGSYGSAGSYTPSSLPAPAATYPSYAPAANAPVASPPATSENEPERLR